MQPNRPISIEDADDPRIAAFRDIRDRDLRDRDGLFVAEGKVVLSVLARQARFDIHSVLVLDRRLAGMEPVLSHLPPAIPVHVAPQDVLDRIAGFHLHRGVLALARRGRPLAAAGLLAGLPADCVVPVLVGISNHDNVGAIFRNAAAFGAPAVMLDATTCDPLYRKAIRVSVGATLSVPYAVEDDAASLVAMFDAAGFSQYALSPSGTHRLSTLPVSGRAALYLGTEGEGLPVSLMARMKTVRIPISPDFDSLNVAAASAIALNHFFRG